MTLQSAADEIKLYFFVAAHSLNETFVGCSLSRTPTFCHEMFKVVETDAGKFSQSEVRCFSRKKCRKQSSFSNWFQNGTLAI